MQLVARSLLFLLLLTAGCGGKKTPPPPGFADPGLAGPVKSAAQEPRKLIVTPATVATGKVAMVNNVSRFVVLNYPLGHLPATDQRLNLYRAGLKVGEVRITGPQYDDNVVADLVAGEGEVGDEARE